MDLEKILPANGPSINEVRKYIEKYLKEIIVIKCGGSVLLDKNLFKQFIKDVSVMHAYDRRPRDKTPITYRYQCKNLAGEKVNFEMTGNGTFDSEQKAKKKKLILFLVVYQF